MKKSELRQLIKEELGIILSPLTEAVSKANLKGVKKDFTSYRQDLRYMNDPSFGDYVVLKKLVADKYKSRVDNKTYPAVIHSVYLLKKKNIYKARGVTMTTNEMVSTVQEISKSEFDKYKKNALAITPDVSKADMNHAEKLSIDWLNSQLAERVADEKKKLKAGPAAGNWKSLRTFIFKSVNSIKGAQLNGKEETGIIAVELPYKFKPTIAKFEQEGSLCYAVDTKSKTVYTTTSDFDDVVYNGINTSRSTKIGTYTDVKQIPVLIKKGYRVDKAKEIKKFNDSDANDWKY